MRSTTLVVALAVAMAGGGCMRSFEFPSDGNTGDTIDTGGDPGPWDTGADTDAGDVHDTAGDVHDTGYDTAPDAHADLDGDGFTPAMGDCDDANPMVNPAAWDDPGNGLDDDCNGMPDDPASACDCATGTGLAAAIGLCDLRFLVSVAEVAYTDAADAGRMPVARYGSATNGLPVHEGCAYAILDTGPVAPVAGGTCDPDRQPGTDFSGGCFGGEPDPDPAGADGTLICDVQQIVLGMVAPSNARAFGFDLAFVSTEYPEWVGTEFNDTFYALLDRGSEPRINITADPGGTPLTVSNPFLEDPPVTDLAGTGYGDLVPDGSTGATVPCGSSTGWLRTTWPIDPGESFTLTFSIHDEGDGLFDSLVILDAFRWFTGPVDPGTLII